MRNIIITILLLTSQVYCFAQPKIKQDNFVVVLDLSDRLLQADQAKSDIALIKETATEFVRNAKSKIAIRSEDSFKLVIIDQPGSQLNISEIQSSFYLDLRQLPMAMRAKRLIDWEKGLDQKLSKLYKEAQFSNQANEYQGVDIWKYFHEHLEDDLIKNGTNHILVITDGYFDFESYTHQKIQGNRYTSTRFFRNLNSNNWMEAAIEKDYGLLPANDFGKYDIYLIVGSIRPKKENDLLERDKLNYFWKKWATEMSIKEPVMIQYTYTEKMVGLLFNEFKSFKN